MKLRHSQHTIASTLTSSNASKLSRRTFLGSAVAGGSIAWSTVAGGAEEQDDAKKTRRNIELMKKFETMINTADELLAEELIWNQAPFATPASPEPLYGGKGYLSVVHWMRKGFSDVQWKIVDLVADANKVAVQWTLTGTHDGEFLGVKPTGKKIKVTVMNFYYFNEEGKIVNDVAAEGMIGILRPLGLSK
ncbi:MAG: ester cyclase [Thermoguttaceae bacterium]|nr:ester cyclase [Thermoguttaceae bacterium]